MSHYLPLLLVSVSTNAALISDDSHMETQPRGQVDYLSHDWDEEDVWRSWRNMTRQKNEIANGMRLENASWRTWWKQRNKLKTVTPETLNWLKDSDVTWLYGPLHTAVDWTPPPKPRQDPTSVDDRAPSSAHDRLDLAQRHKPILKHRSTREQLTSDIPSGLVSPRIPEHLDGISENAEEEDEEMLRPGIAHTKSDSHVLHANKTASPRMQTERNLIALGLNPTQEAPTPTMPAHSPSPSPQPMDRVNSASSSSHSASPSPGGAPRDRKKSKHITFNTYVEQCIAIDKPQNPSPLLIRHSASNINLRREKQFSMPIRSSSQPSLNVKLPVPSQPPPNNKWDGRTSGVRWAGNVEDEHDDSSPSSSSDEAPPFVPPVRQAKSDPWTGGKGSAIGSSDDDDYEDVWEETTTESSTSTNRDEEDDDDDDALEMRSSRSSSLSRSESSPNPRPGLIRQGSHSDSSVLGVAKKRRRSSNGTVVQGGSAFGDVRSPSIVDFGAALDVSTPTPEANHHTQTHLTIAPMAPTTLKIGWDSFGVTPPTADSKFAPTDWMEGFGDEYGEDGDYSLPPPSVISSPGVIQQDGGGELRYVPPKYPSSGSVLHDSPHAMEENEDMEGGSRVWHHEQAYFSTADADRASDEASSTSDGKTQQGVVANRTAPIPVVVRTPPVRDVPQVDAYDYFEGPDLGEDFGAPVRSGARRSYGSKGPSSQDAPEGNERQSRRISPSADEGQERGRSRSRSRSRTPSPLNSPPTVSPTFRSVNSKLSPPSRTNGPSSPRAIVSTSPTGNASSLFDSVGSAYAGDRSDQRAREQTSHSTSPPVDRSERGRQRTERKLSHSLSPPNVSRVNAAAKTAVGIQDANEARTGNPTPLNSPSVGMGMSDGVWKKEAEKSGKRGARSRAESSQSPPASPTGNVIMGRAVGMVSSAGAYFGLWRGGDGTTTTTQVRSP